MKVPEYIRDRMHKIAYYHKKASVLSETVDNWFIERGFDIEELRVGDGFSLEELDYGNDIADILCGRIENGEFGPYGERKDHETDQCI